MAKARLTKEQSAIPRSRTALLQKAVKTLAIDIGATRIKASTLNELGEIVTKRVFTDTPRSGMPGAVMDIIAKLAEEQPEYDRISVGFPALFKTVWCKRRRIWHRSGSTSTSAKFWQRD